MHHYEKRTEVNNKQEAQGALTVTWVKGQKSLLLLSRNSDIFIVLCAGNIGTLKKSNPFIYNFLMYMHKQKG